MRMAASAILTVALLLGANPYAEASALAFADAQQFSPGYASQVRYALLLGATLDDRREQWAAVSFALNSVSRVRRITVPAVIDPDYRVVRWSILDYSGRNNKKYNEYLRAYERLLDPSFVTTAVVVSTKNVVSAGAWCGPDYPSLQIACSSAAPLVRADYLVFRLTGDSPTYYAFAGVPLQQADFLKSLGVDKAALESLLAQTEANLFVSRVTGKPRRVVRLPAPFGSVWLTQDVEDESAEKNPIRIPVDAGGVAFEFDASEIFFSRPSGLWGTALFAAGGERQDAVPAGIATDRYGQTGHGEIVPLFSCLRCHEREGFAGLQDFADAQVSLPLLGFDRDAVEKLGEIHDPERLTDSLTHDALTNIKAVARATTGMMVEGDQARAMTPGEATGALVATIERYLTPVTLAVVAREFDCTLEVARGLVQRSNDPVAIALASGGSVTRADYEVGFHTFAGGATP